MSEIWIIVQSGGFWVGTIEGRGLEANQPSNTSQGMKFDNKNKRTCDVVT